MASTPDLLHPVGVEHADYLRDESRKVGRADALAMPRDEAELCASLRAAAARGLSVTIQGARTGIVAGAVPDGGVVLNLQRMNRATGLRRDETGNYFVTVQPGMALIDLRRMLVERHFDTAEWDAASCDALLAMRAGGNFFLPPDPTETSASIGGMIACNASGACSFLYGAMRGYVTALRVALSDGDMLDLRRGRERARQRSFQVITIGGRVIRGDLPAYDPVMIKNAAGYFAAANMELIDLFVGAEGTLGVITSAELRLIPTPAEIWGVMAFLPTLDEALRFVRGVRGDPANGLPAIHARPAAIELFDQHAIALLRRQKMENTAFAHLPDLPGDLHTAIYVEYHGRCENTVADAVAAMADCLLACGGREDATWTATEPYELERFKLFRHAIPEAVNLTIDARRKMVPGLTKLGTDMAVPDDRLDDVMRMYVRDLDAAGLEYVMFGHIGNNHVHVNILPHTQADYEAGRRLYMGWAGQVVRWGGTISAEHGVGKLKAELLLAMYGEEGIAQMRAVKHCLDPGGLLNKGNLFA